MAFIPIEVEVDMENDGDDMMCYTDRNGKLLIGSVDGSVSYDYDISSDYDVVWEPCDEDGNVISGWNKRNNIVVPKEDKEVPEVCDDVKEFEKMDSDTQERVMRMMEMEQEEEAEYDAIIEEWRSGTDDGSYMMYDIILYDMIYDDMIYDDDVSSSSMTDEDFDIEEEQRLQEIHNDMVSRSDAISVLDKSPTEYFEDFFACKNNKVSPPKNIVSTTDKIIEIMTAPIAAGDEW